MLQTDLYTLASALDAEQIHELTEILVNCHQEKMAKAMTLTQGHRRTQATRIRLAMKWLHSVANQPDHQIDGRNEEAVTRAKAAVAAAAYPVD